MMYMAVIVIGMDDSLLPMEVYSAFCQASVCIAVIAFTLIYGVVLAKTFKVFYIFKNLQVANPAHKKASLHGINSKFIYILLTNYLIYFIDSEGLAHDYSNWNINCH